MNWLNTKSVITIIASALFAGTTTHLLQKRAVSRLRSENQNLLAQRDMSNGERDVALSSAKANRDELTQLEKNQKELLRLRNEIGVLRNQVSEADKLRLENRRLLELQNSSAAIGAKATSDPELNRKRQKGRDAKILATALFMYANEHKQQYPARFDQAESYLGEWLRNDLNPGDVLRDLKDFIQVTNQFDIVYQGNTKSLTNLGETIVLREKRPWLSNGKWMKTYGFADGHGETMSEPAEGFEAWEKKRIVQSP